MEQYEDNMSNSSASIFLNEEENYKNFQPQKEILSIESENYQNFESDTENNFYLSNNDNNYLPQEYSKVNQNNLYLYGGNNFNYNLFFREGKKKTKIDLLKYNSIEFKKFRMFSKIKTMLLPFSLQKSLIDEICTLTWFYSKKLHKQLSTLVPIILYKLIKKYNISNITLKDLKQKLNFKYRNYFKNEKFFPEMEQYKNTLLLKKDLGHSISSEKFITDVKNFIIKCISTLKKNYEEKKLSGGIRQLQEKRWGGNDLLERGIDDFNGLNFKEGISCNEREFRLIIKMSEKLLINEKIVEKIYIDPVILELDYCQEQCLKFINENMHNSKDDIKEKNKINKGIYEVKNETKEINEGIKEVKEIKEKNKLNDLNENGTYVNVINLDENKEEEVEVLEKLNFVQFINNRISSYNIAISMIKFFIDKNKSIKITFQYLKDNFNFDRKKIKNGINLIQSYISYCNKI